MRVLLRSEGYFRGMDSTIISTSLKQAISVVRCAGFYAAGLTRAYSMRCANSVGLSDVLWTHERACVCVCVCVCV